jgi:cytochrome c-type biogenesis protein CcmH
VRRAIALLLAALALAPSALAATPQFTMDEIEREVMCPVCGTRLDLSHSPAAEQIRTYVARKRDAGWTKAQVEDALVAQFGPSIRAETPSTGSGLVAWLVPVAAAVGGVAIAVVAILVWRRRSPGSTATLPTVALDADAERRVDEALAAFDDPAR